MSLPWQANIKFFSAAGSAGKHHFIPKAAFLKRYLEPSEWAGVANKTNHLRELDLTTGQIDWRGINVAGQVKNLNSGPTLTSETYWGLDDTAMATFARRLADGDLDYLLLMVPAIAALTLRDPSVLDRLKGLAPTGPHATDWAVGAQIVLADRVKLEWITATELGAVRAKVMEAPEVAANLLVVPDVPVLCAHPGTTDQLQRPPFLWDREWFADDGDPEPKPLPALELQMPISSRMYVCVTADLDDRSGTEAEADSLADADVLTFNKRSAARANKLIWAGREQDLKPLP